MQQVPRKPRACRRQRHGGMKTGTGLQVKTDRWSDLSKLWDTGLSPDGVWPWVIWGGK